MMIVLLSFLCAGKTTPVCVNQAMLCMVTVSPVLQVSKPMTHEKVVVIFLMLRFVIEYMPIFHLSF